MENRIILALDVGSTTTKARLFSVGKSTSVLAVSDSPTTVESPEEDVMVGVKRAVKSVQERTGRRLLDEKGQIWRGQGGVDQVAASSSAGGGLQMVVTGVWRKMTAESAQRAALGAGAVLLDVHHINDGRLSSERVRQLRTVNADMLLMTGGTEGGQISHVMKMAEFVRDASPKPRFGSDKKLPVIYAGNSEAVPLIRDVLSEAVDLHLCANLRPEPHVENLQPVRERIHEIFMEHVMAHAPGYFQLISEVDGSILPTPGAFGVVMRRLYGMMESDVLGVDLGGATTDIFSIIGGELYRTVSANLGMSYSISNVLANSTTENIRRWLPFNISGERLREWTLNKMIRPTTLPQTEGDLMMEHSMAREAMRLALQHHHQLVVGLRGAKLAEKDSTGSTSGQLLEKSGIEAIIGSGGVLSHAADPRQAMGMIVDAFEPEGLTRILVDQGFMMPHLGAIAQTDEESALSLIQEVLMSIGWCLSPVEHHCRPGETLAELRIFDDNGFECTARIKAEELSLLHLGERGTYNLEVLPERKTEMGLSAQKKQLRLWQDNEVLLLDGRNRPVHQSMRNVSGSSDVFEIYGYKRAGKKEKWLSGEAGDHGE